MTDYYRLGAGLGDAYVDRQNMEMKRRAQESELQDAALRRRQLEGAIDDQEYSRKRTRGFDAERDAYANDAPGTGLPGQGAQAGVSDGAPSSGGAGGAPNQRPAKSRGDRARLLAKQAFQKGLDPSKYEADAQMADFEDAFNKGAQEVDIDKWIAAGNTSDAPIAIHKDKNGYEMIIIRPNGSTSKVSMNEAQMRQLAGYKAALQINPQLALQGMAKIDGDLAALYATKFSQQLEASKANNTATHYGNQDAIQRARLGVERDKADFDKRMAKFGPQVQTIGPDGSPAVLQGMVEPGQAPRFEPVQLPPGHRLPRQVDPRAVEARAAALVGKPTGRTINGKPEVFDDNTAYVAAHQQLSNPQEAVGPGGFRVPGNLTPDQVLKNAAPPAPPKRRGLADPNTPAAFQFQDRGQFDKYRTTKPSEHR